MIEPALTPDEWAKAEIPSDATEVQAIQMRTGDRAIYSHRPHAQAALCLHNQPFGFTWDDVHEVREAADGFRRGEHGINAAAGESARLLDSLADRIEALLPPEAK